MNSILNEALSSGIIDIASIEQQINMSKRKEYLKSHPYSIWQGKNKSWYTYLPDKERGRVLKQKQTKEEIENIIVSYQKELEKSPLIRELFEKREDRRLNNNQISKATYTRYDFVFKRHYKEFGENKISAVSLNDWCDFIESEVASKNLTRKGFNNLRTITSAILKQADRENLIDYSFEDVYEKISEDLSFHKKIIRDCDEVYDEIETETIMDYLIKNQNSRNLALLLMFVTGARIGEIAALKPEEISEKCIFICRTETSYMDKNIHKRVYQIKEYPKTDESVRTAVVPAKYEWLLRKIKLLNPFGEYCFFEKGKRIDTRKLRERLKYVCRKNNINYRPPHKIRKTYITILLDNHIDKNLVKNQVGHSDILVSEKHYHRNRKTIDKKQEILSNLSEFC